MNELNELYEAIKDVVFTCEDMELEIYREHSGRDYCFFNWTEWFADNYSNCEYFEDLFISDNSE